MPSADPNALRYFIIEAQTGRSVSVRFEPLTVTDVPELSNEDWVQAVFAPTWQRLVYKEHVYKLMRTDELGKRIQGLVHVGVAAPGGTYLTKSLLEAAPFNQRSKNAQDYYNEFC